MSTQSHERPMVALVTVASRGIGFEVARQLAQRGMIVLLAARVALQSASAATRLADEGLDVRPQTLDVSRDESVHQLAAAVEQEFGQLDILVNNAAAFVAWTETALGADLHDARQVFETNLFGTWRTCQVFVPLLRRSARGRIVLVSSGAGSHGDAQFGLTTNHGSVASYGISIKAGVELTQIAEWN